MYKRQVHRNIFDIFRTVDRNKFDIFRTVHRNIFDIFRTVDRNERDRLVFFLSKLILNRENVVDVLRYISGGLKLQDLNSLLFFVLILCNLQTEIYWLNLESKFLSLDNIILMYSLNQACVLR